MYVFCMVTFDVITTIFILLQLIDCYKTTKNDKYDKQSFLAAFIVIHNKTVCETQIYKEKACLAHTKC